MNDYISREDVLETLRKANIGGYITDRLLEIPAADVQPIRHGRWENEYLDDDDVWCADCTNCNNDTHSRFGRVSIYAYCPNCGAKMIKDGDTE